MDIQMLVNILIGLVIFFGGYYFRDLKKEQERQDDRLRAVELLIATSYVTKEEFCEFKKAAFSKLDKIHDGVTECRINSAHNSSAGIITTGQLDHKC